MRLPLTFIPRRGQQVTDVVAALVLSLIALSFVLSYTPAAGPKPGEGFVQWLGGGAAVGFIVMSTALFVGALGWVAVAILNLATDSPFKYLRIDRFGITHRSFWREKRYSWKELEPIAAQTIGLLRARTSRQRYWIVEQDVRHAGMRIPAGDYLDGALDRATEAAAQWLESLRGLACADRLEPDDFPPPPPVLRLSPSAGERPSTDADLVPQSEPPRPSFGKRTIER
jgi:hypothetical protein